MVTLSYYTLLLSLSILRALGKKIEAKAIPTIKIAKTANATNFPRLCKNNAALPKAAAKK